MPKIKEHFHKNISDHTIEMSTTVEEEMENLKVKEIEVSDLIKGKVLKKRKRKALIDDFGDLSK